MAGPVPKYCRTPGLGSLVAVGLVACNAILGIEQRPLREDSDEAGASASDGGRDRPDSSGTGPLADSGSESAYRKAVMADKPMAYWRLNETGGNTAFDEHDESGQVAYNGFYSDLESGNGNVLGRPGALQGDTNLAAGFNASPVRIGQNGLDFEGSAPFSVEVWAKANDPNGDYGFLVDHETHDPTRKGWVLAYGETGVFFERYQSDSVNENVKAAAPAKKVWHHIVGTFDGTKMELFVDTKSVGTHTSTVNVPRLAGNGWTLGSQNCTCVPPGGDYSGLLDEVAIYAHALAEDRIQAHYSIATNQPSN